MHLSSEPETITDKNEVCGELICELLHHLIQVPEEDIVKLVGTSAVMQPSYHIVVHHQRRCVVMSIRGTYTAKDVLTDLNPHSEPFEGG